MMKIVAIICATLIGGLFVSAGLATADGPDYYKTGNKPVQLYQNHKLDSKILATLPSNTRALKSLGCENLATYADWRKMNKKQKRELPKKTWCKITYRDFNGWIQQVYLHEDSPPAQPTYDCEQAIHEVEKVICEDATLIELDRKMADIYQSALAKAVQRHGKDSRDVSNLKRMQIGWVKGRNDCWKALENMKTCITQNYLNRLTYLQTAYRLIEPHRTNKLVCDSAFKTVKISFFETDFQPSIMLSLDNRRDIYISAQSATDKTHYNGDFGRYIDIYGNKVLLKWDQFQPEVVCHL